MSNHEQVQQACLNLAQRLEVKHSLLESHLKDNHELQVLYSDSKSFLVVLASLAREVEANPELDNVEQVITVLTAGETIDEELSAVVELLVPPERKH